MFKNKINKWFKLQNNKLNSNNNNIKTKEINKKYKVLLFIKR